MPHRDERALQRNDVRLSHYKKQDRWHDVSGGASTAGQPALDKAIETLFPLHIRFNRVLIVRGDRFSCGRNRLILDALGLMELCQKNISQKQQCSWLS